MSNEILLTIYDDNEGLISFCAGLFDGLESKNNVFCEWLIFMLLSPGLYNLA
jgi:hypothetical protein